MKYIFLFSFTLLFTSVFSQGFDFDDTVKLVNKPTDASTPPHEYFQFYNYSGDSLNVRWKINQSLTFYPSQWQLALQDNETYHNPIIDSNDIVIPDSAGAFDKLIINVYSNAFAGYGELVLDVFNLDSLQEMHRIKFQINIYEPHTSGILAFSDIELLRVFPNPATTFITVKIPEQNIKNLQISDWSGKLAVLPEYIKQNERILINIDVLPPGIYLISLESSENKVYRATFIKQ